MLVTSLIMFFSDICWVAKIFVILNSSSVTYYSISNGRQCFFWSFV